MTRVRLLAVMSLVVACISPTPARAEGRGLAPPFASVRSGTTCRGALVGQCDAWSQSDKAHGTTDMYAGLYPVGLVSGYARHDVVFTADESLGQPSPTRRYDVVIDVEWAFARSGELLPQESASVEGTLQAWHSNCHGCESSFSTIPIVLSEAPYLTSGSTPSRLSDARLSLTASVAPALGSSEIPAGTIHVEITFTAVARTGDIVSPPSRSDVWAGLSARLSSLTATDA